MKKFGEINRNMIIVQKYIDVNKIILINKSHKWKNKLGENKNSLVIYNRNILLCPVF